MNEMQPIKSSLLQSYSYDADSMRLDVIFKDGTETTYKDVPPPLMSQVFDSSGSIGSKFLRLIAKTHKGSPTQS